MEPQVAEATPEAEEQVEPQVAEAIPEAEEQVESQVAQVVPESILGDNQSLGLENLSNQNEINLSSPSITQQLEGVDQLQTLSEFEVEDTNILDETESEGVEDASEEEINEIEEEEEEVQVASAEDSPTLAQEESLGLGENNQMLSSSLSPVSSSILMPVSSSGNLNLVSNNFSIVSSLGNLSSVSGSISLLGDTNLQDTILETSDFEATDSETDVATDEGYIEYTSLNNSDESQTNN